MNANIDPQTLSGPFVPATLSVGDIIRCVIPTDFGGRREYPVRNALVAGLECVPGEATVRGLHLVRFSYNFEKFNPDLDFEISQPEQAQWGIGGFHKIVMMRTNRVDLVPVDHQHFPSSVEVRGSVSHPEFFAVLANYLKRGLASEECETSRIIQRNFYGTELRQTLDPYAKAPVPHFDLAEIADIKRTALTDSIDFDIAIRDKERQCSAWATSCDYSPVITARRHNIIFNARANMRSDALPQGRESPRYKPGSYTPS